MRSINALITHLASSLHIPSGGSAGQVLQKTSSVNYATSWIDNPKTMPNLVMNWDFRNPVNQRSITSGSAYSTVGYFLDMWYLVSGYITWTSGTGLALNGTLLQRFENALENRTYTISVMVGGTIYSVNLAYAGTDSSVTAIGASGVSVQFLANSNTWNAIQFSTSASVVIQAVKLEIGDISTLQYDAQMDYGSELSKCKRYLNQLWDKNSRMVFLPEASGYYFHFFGLTTSMRLNNVTPLTSDFKIYSNASGWVTADTVYASGFLCGNFDISGRFPGGVSFPSGFSQGNFYLGSNIPTVSAEL